MFNGVCIYIYTTRDAIFSSSVYERRYSFTGISNKALAGPPVLNRRRSLTEWVGLKVRAAGVHTLSAQIVYNNIMHLHN